MTIRRAARTRRLRLEPLEARDVPSVVTPHALPIRPTGRAEIPTMAHHHARAGRVRGLRAAAPSSTVGAGMESTPIANMTLTRLGPVQVLGVFQVHSTQAVGTAVPIASSTVESRRLGADPGGPVR